MMTTYDLAVALAKRQEEEGYTYEDLMQTFDEAVAEAQKWLRLKERIMKDTIYRDDAIKAVCSGCLEENKECKHHWDCPMLTNLEKLPSADRPQGEWIEEEYKGRIYGIYRCQYKCFHCGYVPMHRGEPIIPTNRTLRFCPNCGARMKGADGETD